MSWLNETWCCAPTWCQNASLMGLNKSFYLFFFCLLHVVKTANSWFPVCRLSQFSFKYYIILMLPQYLLSDKRDLYRVYILPSPTVILSTNFRLDNSLAWQIKVLFYTCQWKDAAMSKCMMWHGIILWPTCYLYISKVRIMELCVTKSCCMFELCCTNSFVILFTVTVLFSLSVSGPV